MIRFALATGSTKTAVLVFAWTIRSFLASIVWDAAHPVRSAIAAAVRTRIAAFAPMNPPVGLVSGGRNQRRWSRREGCHALGNCFIGRPTDAGSIPEHGFFSPSCTASKRLGSCGSGGIEDASERSARRPRLERRNERGGHVPRSGA